MLKHLAVAVFVRAIRHLSRSKLSRILLVSLHLFLLRLLVVILPFVIKPTVILYLPDFILAYFEQLLLPVITEGLLDLRVQLVAVLVVVY